MSGWWIVAALAFPTDFTSKVPTGGSLVEQDPLCSDVPEAESYVEPVAQPAAGIKLPPVYCLATTTAELQQHVATCKVPDIVIAPGTYSPVGLWGAFLGLPTTRRLWSASSTGVVLQFGVSLSTHAGSELHGLQIDLADEANAVPLGPGGSGGTAGIAFWGSDELGSGEVVIEDTTVRGGGQVSAGIVGTYAEGARVARVGLQGFRRFGMRLEHSGAVTVPMVVEDVVVRDVGDPAWRLEPVCDDDGLPEGCYSPGTAEHGVWIGASADVQRVQVRDVWWAGLITGNCGGGCGDPLTGVHLWEIDVDRIGVDSGFGGAGSGVAFERVIGDSDVGHICVGPQTERGVHFEWNHFLPAESATNVSVTKGVLSSDTVGVFLGSGTLDTHLDDLVITSAGWAGVAMECCGVADPATCSSTNIGDHVDVTAPLATATCEMTAAQFGGSCTCP